MVSTPQHHSPVLPCPFLPSPSLILPCQPQWHPMARMFTPPILPLVAATLLASPVSHKQTGVCSSPLPAPATRSCIIFHPLLNRAQAWGPFISACQQGPGHALHVTMVVRPQHKTKLTAIFVCCTAPGGVALRTGHPRITYVDRTILPLYRAMGGSPTVCLAGADCPALVQWRTSSQSQEKYPTPNLPCCCTWWGSGTSS